MTKDLIAYCGLYCGDCFGYTGEVADLSRDLRKVLRKNRFEKIAGAIPFKEFKHYRECYEVLGALVKLRCKNACRGGGGNPFCKIRKCAQKRELDGCWECAEFKDCGMLKSLESVHKDAHLKNLRIIKKKGKAEFVKGKRYW